MQFNSHVSFDGKCEQAFRFYHQVFGGEIVTMMPYEGSPVAGQVAPEWRGKILHASLQVGEHWIMGGDAPPDRYQRPQGFSIGIQLSDPVEAERIFNALADGGSMRVPLAETFWAQRFGMLVDRFGVPWLVNCGKVS